MAFFNSISGRVVVPSPKTVITFPGPVISYTVKEIYTVYRLVRSFGTQRQTHIGKPSKFELFWKNPCKYKDLKWRFQAIPIRALILKKTVYKSVYCSFFISTNKQRNMRHICFACLSGKQWEKRRLNCYVVALSNLFSI